MKYDITDAERYAAQDYADEYARIDGRTKDPDGLKTNKAASRLSERLVTRRLGELGYEPKWLAEGDDTAEYDVRVGGLRIDVKCSTNDPSKANLMPADYILADDRNVDALIQCRVDPELTTCEIYGFVTVDEFKEESEYFYPTRCDRMLNSELNELSEIAEVIPEAIESQ